LKEEKQTENGLLFLSPRKKLPVTEKNKKNYQFWF
jgi:hypothetical protein